MVGINNCGGLYTYIIVYFELKINPKITFHPLYFECVNSKIVKVSGIKSQGKLTNKNEILMIIDVKGIF